MLNLLVDWHSHLNRLLKTTDDLVLSLDYEYLKELSHLPSGVSYSSILFKLIEGITMIFLYLISMVIGAGSGCLLAYAELKINHLGMSFAKSLEVTQTYPSILDFVMSAFRTSTFISGLTQIAILMMITPHIIFSRLNPNTMREIFEGFQTAKRSSKIRQTTWYQEFEEAWSARGLSNTKLVLLRDDPLVSHIPNNYYETLETQAIRAFEQEQLGILIHLRLENVQRLSGVYVTRKGTKPSCRRIKQSNLLDSNQVIVLDRTNKHLESLIADFKAMPILIEKAKILTKLHIPSHQQEMILSYLSSRFTTRHVFQKMQQVETNCVKKLNR